MTKRLEGAAFRWPPIEDGMIRMSATQLSTLLEGLQWSHVEPRQPAPAKAGVIRPSATQ
jgi:transposase